LVLLALVLLGAAFVLAPMGRVGVAGADAPDQVGWWNKLNGGATSGLPVAPPVGPPVATPAPPLDPSAPAGAIQLAVDPSGPTGIGAVRYDSVPDGSDVTLVLKSSRPLPPPQVFSVVLCTATTPWVGTENGVWSSRPSWSSTCATPEVASDTLTWHLDSSYVDGGLSAVLVPSAAAAFQVTINPPDANSLAYDAPPAEEEPAPAPPPVVEAPVESPVVTAPIVQEPVITTPPVTAAPRPRITPPTLVARPAASLPRPFKDTTRAERITAVLLLLGLVGAWWWVGGQPARNPRLLGAVGAGPAAAGAGAAAAPVGTQSVTTVARLGGVGRFAKLRTTAPRRL
jgi:hypothetical protein